MNESISILPEGNISTLQPHIIHMIYMKLEAFRAKNRLPGPTCPNAILESPLEQFLAIFYLQVTLELPIKSISLWVQKKVKIDFQVGPCRRPSWISNLNNFS